MQSTWENLVEYDMSESGVRPLTLRELGDLGFDLEHALDLPLGYSQSNGTLELREKLAAFYPGATIEQIEVTNGTSEANYLLALSLLRDGDEMALEIPNYMQLWGVPRSLGARCDKFRLRLDRGWEPDWEEFQRAVTPETRLVYISNPNNPTGAVLSEEAMQRIVERCEAVGAYLIADEVYQGAEIHGAADHELLGHERSRHRHQRTLQSVGDSRRAHRLDRGTRQGDGGMLGAARLSDHRSEQTVGSGGAHGGGDRNREKCYARTREILQHNLPAMREWIAAFAGFLEWRDPVAGAMALIRYGADIPSYELCERVRQNQSTLIVPGIHLGLEGYIRVWMGGRPEFLAEGFRRIGTELRQIALRRAAI